MKFNAKKVAKFLFSCSLLLSTTLIKAQTSVGYTVDLYVDNNGNLIHDGGEPYLNNGYNIVPIRGGNACGGYYSTGSFYGNCPGALYGGYVQSCSSGTYVVEAYDLGNMIQPGISVNNYTMTGNTSSVTNIPCKPSILNQAFLTNIYTQFQNTNAPFPTMWTYAKAGGIPDTAMGTICNNSNINIAIPYNFESYNLNNCNPVNQILNFKVDGTTIDSYSFTAGATNNYSVIPLSTGTVQVWYGSVLPYMAGFTYSVNNYPAPSPGYHTFSIESVPVGMSYTATTVMKSVFYVEDCGQFSGNTYVDCNTNCTKNVNEYYPGYIMNLNLASATNTIYVMPDANGNYTVNAPIGTYTVNAIPYGGYTVACGSPTAITTVTTGSTYTFNVVLNEVSAPATDFSSYLNLSGANPGPGAVPGGTVTINVYNNRTGSACAVIPNPTALKVTLPPAMSFGTIVGTTPAPSSIISAASGDTIVWNSPAPNGLHQFTAITATSAVIGSNYCITSMILPMADGDALNNIYNRCRTYGGPFDPNAKTSEAPGMAANGDILPSTTDLVYTLEFQNLGTGKAVNVTIKDTINSNLDINSLQILSSSFPVQAQVNTVNNLVDFKFPNINLLPAVINEPASHGYVRYKIDLKPSLPLGTKITNRGHIYFDYNSAVATNKTINTIASPLGINEVKAIDAVNLFPNPTKGLVTVSASENLKSLQVYNVTGELMLNVTNLNSKTTTVDLQLFAKGLYFMRTETKDGKSITKKIILE